MGISTKRNIQVEKPVKLIFVGGFLGSGKTTALAAIAKRLLEQGKRVGIITNDQSDNLADTVIVRELLGELGVPIEEVVAGCFCCKFEELIDNIEKILVRKRMPSRTDATPNPGTPKGAKVRAIGTAPWP